MRGSNRRIGTAEILEAVMGGVPGLVDLHLEAPGLLFSQGPLFHLCENTAITVSLIKTLLANSQDTVALVTMQDEMERTPLHLLCSNESMTLDIIQTLLSVFPNDGSATATDKILGVQDRDGRTPLHHACANPKVVQDLAIVQTLTGDINAQRVPVLLEDETHKVPTTLTLENDCCRLEILGWLFQYSPVHSRELPESCHSQVRLVASQYVSELVDNAAADMNFLAASRTEQHGWVRFSQLVDDVELVHIIQKFITNSDPGIVRTLADVEGVGGHEAIEIATKPIRVAMRESLLFYHRYDLDESPKYESPTCKVFFAKDCSSRQNDAKITNEVAINTPVALKFFFQKEHFDAEKESRFIDPDDPDTSRFHNDFVIAALDMYDGDNDTKFREAAKRSDLPPYCIVLAQGERNLTEAVGAENLTNNALLVCSVLFELAQCLQHIHTKKYVHGDFKPKNLVRQVDDRRWNLIDFDATTKIGQRMSSKASTAFMPPEAVAVENKEPVILAQCSNPDKGILADTSFDVWSYGVVMYQLVTETPSFWDGVDNYDNLNRKGLKALAFWTDEDTKEKLHGLVGPVRDLLQLLLSRDPSKRPPMSDVVGHEYFAPKRKLIELEARLSEARTSNSTELALIRNDIKNTEQVLLENQKATKEEIASGFQGMSSQLKEMSSTLDSLSEHLQSHSRMLKTLIHASDVVPVYCIFVPQSRSTWWDGLKPFKTVKVYYVCPVTLDVPLDEDGKFHHHEIELPIKWLQTIGPSLFLGLKILPYALAVGRCAGFPLPCLRDVGDALESRLAAVTELRNMILKDLENFKDGETFETSKEVLQAEGLAPLKNESKHQAFAKQTIECMKKIASLAGDPTFERCGLVKVTSTPGNESMDADGTTMYVSASANPLFETFGAGCFEMTRAKISSEMDRLNAKKQQEIEAENAKLKDRLAEKDRPDKSKQEDPQKDKKDPPEKGQRKSTKADSKQQVQKIETKGLEKKIEHEIEQKYRNELGNAKGEVHRLREELRRQQQSNSTTNNQSGSCLPRFRK